MGDSVKCCVCTYNWIISARNSVYNEIDDILNFTKPNNKKQKKQSFSNISFMISSVVLLFSVIILAKDSIAKTFPATQDIYYNLGLMNHQKINDNVLLILTSNNQKSVKNSMVLKGIIHNKLNNTLKKPTILVELLNNKGNLIENHIKLDLDLAKSIRSISYSNTKPNPRYRIY